MNRKKRHKRILRQLVKSGWCVECCYVASRKCDVGGLAAIEEWSMPFGRVISPSLPPFKHAENRLVFVLRNLDGRRNAVSGFVRVQPKSDLR